MIKKHFDSYLYFLFLSKLSELICFLCEKKDCFKDFFGKRSIFPKKTNEQRKTKNKPNESQRKNISNMQSLISSMHSKKSFHFLQVESKWHECRSQHRAPHRHWWQWWRWRWCMNWVRWRWRWWWWIHCLAVCLMLMVLWCVLLLLWCCDRWFLFCYFARLCEQWSRGRTRHLELLWISFSFLFLFLFFKFFLKNK